MRLEDIGYRIGRRHSLSCHRPILFYPYSNQCYTGHFNKQRSHSAPPDIQDYYSLKERRLSRRSRRRLNKRIKQQKKIIDKRKERRDRGCGIPGRWLNYSVSFSVGPIEGTRFIAFKTPLHPYFFASEETKKHRFDVDTIVKHIAAQNKTLGLVIDLTDTNRYYDPNRWKRHKVEYNKLNCPGHQVNRDENLFETFLQLIRDFFSENTDNEKLIGVHCTHGLNRTGYLICRYLIQENNWSADHAIKSFAAARGYPIERSAYIQSLYMIERMMNSK